MAQARTFGDVDPVAGPVVSEQPGPSSASDLAVAYFTAGCDEDVEITVAVEIEECDARAERVEDGDLIRRAAFGNDVEPEVVGPVDEPRPRRGRLRSPRQCVVQTFGRHLVAATRPRECDHDSEPAE